MRLVLFPRSGGWRTMRRTGALRWVSFLFAGADADETRHAMPDGGKIWQLFRCADGRRASRSVRLRLRTTCPVAGS